MTEIINTFMDSVKRPILYRNIIITTTLNDIKTKYAGSILGYFWLLFFPVLFLSMYAFVYIMIFKVRLNMLSPYEYVLVIFSGLIPFLSFSESLGRGVQAVTANANLIKNTLFPIELIPIQITLSSQVLQLVGFLGITVILLLLNKLDITIFLLPIVWILQIIFTIGILWILSALNVFFRDISNIIPIIVLMLMMISPIAYTEDMIPENLRVILHLNPLYYLIILYQKILIFGQFDTKLFFSFLLIAIFHYFIGYYIFTRLKDVFSDYV